MCAVKLITDLSELGEVEAQWDRLAVACQAPMMSPACVMAWWRHLAPATACARVVVLEEDETLIGIAPFYIDPAARRGRRDLRLPGIEIGARLAPLALPGREADVAQEIMRTVIHTEPRPDLIALEGMPLAFNWPHDMQTRSPGRVRPTVWQYQVLSCPVVTLNAKSFDEWLSGKSSKFRSQMRRAKRDFAAAGGTERISTLETLRGDIAALMHLHESRWTHRGRSSFAAYGNALPAMLHDIGQTLLKKDGRFRLRMLEIDKRPICADLTLSAGGRVIGMISGWDDHFANLKPSMLAMLGTIEEALSRGDRLFDLGVVDKSYKLRFADTNAPVSWTILLPKGMRFPKTYCSVTLMVGRHTIKSAIKQRASSEQRDRYRRLRQRLRERRLAT